MVVPRNQHLRDKSLNKEWKTIISSPAGVRLVLPWSGVSSAFYRGWGFMQTPYTFPTPGLAGGGDRGGG